MALDTNRLVSFVQRELNARYGLKLTVDGRVGPNTLAALNRVSAVPSHFTKGKRFVAFIQYLTHVEPKVDDIAIDGLYGPATENAMRQLLAIDATGQPDNWRDNLEREEAPYAHFSRIVRTRDESGISWPEERDLERFYGVPGSNWVSMSLPFPMRLAWDKSRTITRFSVNKKIKPYAENMYDEVLSVYGIDGIADLGLDLWAGAAVVRKIRGGSRYSSHSYGCSIDVDSARNALRTGKDRATLSKPEYEDFWTAVYRQGGKSLGIESALAGKYNGQGYDFMHFGWYNYK